MQRVTAELHKKVKVYNQWHTTRQTARKFDISEKTMLQIRGSRNFDEYTENNKAQHPGTGHSLLSDLLDIHNIMFNEHNNRYFAPRTGKQAALDIKLKLLKERREA